MNHLSDLAMRRSAEGRRIPTSRRRTAMSITFPRPPIDHGRTSPACVARYHGTASAYARAGCRCDEARDAFRVDQKRRREGRSTPKRIGILGTQRRLRALSAIGWRWADVGQMVGVTGASVQAIALGVHPTIYVGTAARIAAAYDRLSMTIGPSRITEQRARAKGWAPPLAWEGIDIDNPASVPDFGGEPDPEIVDEVAVRRAMAGEMRFKDLRDAERIALFRDHAPGDRALRRLKVSGETAQRWRNLALRDAA
jgi:hypothetical protein